MTGIERLRQFAKGCRLAGQKVYSNAIADIADQIERESDVETVRSDAMEAWRWVRRRGGIETLELHEETFADLMRQRDEYRDLARGYERDATWVREHGGLDAVIAVWENDVPLAEAVISELWPDGRPDECGNDIVMEELRRRLMPEGMEWMLWDDGKPVTYDDAPDDVIGVYLALDGSGYVLMTDLPDQLMSESSERVRRPAVLAADGEPLEVGQTVWRIDTGAEYWVKSGQTITSDAVVIIRKTDCDCESEIVKASQLTHQRPVLDADGVPIREGDTVWDTDAESDTPLTVVEVSSDLIRCEYTWKDGKTYRPCYPPDQLTHQRPDSWERIEEDAKKDRCSYFGAKYQDCGICTQLATSCSISKARDLVRRCRALAERERGE